MTARAPRPPMGITTKTSYTNKRIFKAALLLPSRQWVISQLQ